MLSPLPVHFLDMNAPPKVPAEIQARIALMVAAERAQMEALDSQPNMEIVGVSSVLGAGAMGSPTAGEWSLRLSLARWREVDGARRGEGLRMRLITNETEIDRIVDAIPGPTVVRMLVRMFPPSNPSPDTVPSALLVELLDAPFEDAEMAAVAAQLEAEDLARQTALEPPDNTRKADVVMTFDALIAAVKKKLPPAPEAEIAKLELSLGCRLVEDYRSFLAACNGGYLSGELRFVEQSPSSDAVETSIHHIGGFREESHFSLTWARAIYADRIPDDLLWIMDDPCGNAICLGLRGAHQGRVYFWDHENEPDDDWDGTVENAGNIVLLANTFSDFVAGLRPRDF